MIFVTGIHGVGKTTFCYKLAKEKKCMAYSASELISRKIHKIYTEKKVDSIDQNQKYLINAVNSIYEKEKEFILVGHLCLLDENGNIKQIKKEAVKKKQGKLSKLWIILKRCKILERDGTKNRRMKFTMKEMDSLDLKALLNKS